MLPAAAGGVLVALSVPPAGFWPLAFAGVALVCLALDGVGAPDTTTWHQRAGVGLVFGLFLYGITLSWMGQFSGPGMVVVAALEAAFTAAALAVLPSSRAPRWVPAGLMLADAARSLWPFGGLPLGGIDLGQAAGPLAPLVTFGGRLLLVGVTAALGSLPYLFVKQLVRARTNGRTSRALASATGAVALYALVVAANLLPAGVHGTGTTVRVAIIQGGGPRGQWASPDNARLTYERHLETTTKLSASAGADVVLWPEDTVDVNVLEGSSELRELAGESARLDAPLVVGAPERLEPRDVNQQVVITASGVVERYEKVRRVPFGEYFPFRDTIEGLGLAELPARDYRPGSATGVLHPAGITFGVLVSYEGFFDDRGRGAVRAGAQVLLIPTNASSYVTMQVPSQQLAAARLRALETRRWVVQAAPTGVSAVVSPMGRVVWHSEVEERALHVAEVERIDGLTPYARLNDLPVLVAMLGPLAAVQVIALRDLGRRVRRRGVRLRDGSGPGEPRQ